MKTTPLRLLAALLVIAALFISPSARAQKPASDISSGIAAKLQPFVDNHSLAGAVTLVANKDKVLAVDTVGSMDIGANKPMRPDALFWIASQSKPITGTALSTNMSFDRKRNLITVWLVQHAGFPKDGSKAASIFKQTADEIYGK